MVCNVRLDAEDAVVPVSQTVATCQSNHVVFSPFGPIAYVQLLSEGGACQASRPRPRQACCGGVEALSVNF